MLGNKDWTNSIIIAARANSPRFQSLANENENLSKVCQTFRLLEQRARQAFQTCQTCRFWNLVLNQTQTVSLPSLPFSELAPIKRILIMFEEWKHYGGAFAPTGRNTPIYLYTYLPTYSGRNQECCNKRHYLCTQSKQSIKHFKYLLALLIYTIKTIQRYLGQQSNLGELPNSGC